MYISSYYTGRTLANGKRETKIAAFNEVKNGGGAVVSFPAQLNGFKMPELKEIKSILRGDSVIASEGYTAFYGFASLGSVRFVSPLVLERSSGVTPLADSAESTMQLFQTGRDADGLRGFIEWDIPALETGENIGLWFDRSRRLTDYDGVMSLPAQAVALIRSHGFTVPHEFV